MELEKGRFNILGIRLTDQYKRRLSELADLWGKTMTELAFEAITMHLARSCGNMAAQESYRPDAKSQRLAKKLLEHGQFFSEQMQRLQDSKKETKEKVTA